MSLSLEAKKINQSECKQLGDNYIFAGESVLNIEHMMVIQMTKLQ